MERNLISYFCLSSLQSCWTRQTQRQPTPIRLLCQGGVGAKAVLMKSIFEVGSGRSKDLLQCSLSCVSCLHYRTALIPSTSYPVQETQPPGEGS